MTANSVTRVTKFSIFEIKISTLQIFLKRRERKFINSQQVVKLNDSREELNKTQRGD